MSFNVTDFLISRWESPAQSAVETATLVCSYGELKRLVNQVAARFRGAGVSPGDRVIIVADNSLTFVVSLLATMQLRAIEITISVSEAPARLGPILRQTSPRLVVVKGISDLNFDGDVVESLLVADEVATLHRWETVSDDPRFAAPIASGVVSLAFTSGSTGEPKGAALTGDGMRDTVFAAPHLAEHDGQRLLLGIPLANSYGKTQLLEFLCRAATVVIRNGFGTPEAAWQLIDRSAASVVEGPPGIFELLCRSASFRTRGLPNLRRIGMAGGKMRLGLLQTLMERLPDCTITNRYGVTEISGGLCRKVLSGDQLSAPISCGPPFPWVRLEILDSDGRQQPAGVLGEVWVQSPGVMWGYFPTPCTSRRYHTSDIGLLTGDGELVLVGRGSDLIKRDGVRISAAEVERAMLEHSAVSECVALSLFDETTAQERLGSVVVLANYSVPPSTHELLAVCARHIPRSHLPDRIVFAQSIPLNATGKPDLKAIRTLLANK